MEPTLKNLRQGQEPIWTLIDEHHQFKTPERPGKNVRCTAHLPFAAKWALEAETDQDPEWFPPQYIVTDNGDRWRDNLTCSYFELIDDDFVEFRDTRSCEICAFQQGVTKLRTILNKRKVANTVLEWWMTPDENGRCPYAEWTWRKMKEEVGFCLD